MEWQRYDTNRIRPGPGQRYTKYKIYLSIMMVIWTKQHLNNIWSSIHEEVKEHWGWVWKKALLIEKNCVAPSQLTDKLSLYLSPSELFSVK